MEGAAYDPWQPVEPVDVPIEGGVMINGELINFIRVPWAAAATAEAVMRTATIVAGELVKHLWAESLAAQRQLQAPEALRALTEAKYEPPLVHFHCSGSCGETWDAWVNEDGSLQDKRDVCCANPNCNRLGHPAELVKEDTDA